MKKFNVGSLSFCVFELAFAVLSAVMAFIMLLSRQPVLTDGGYLSAAVMLACSVLLIFGKISFSSLWVDTKMPDKIVSSVLALIIIVMIGMGELSRCGIFHVGATWLCMITLIVYVFLYAVSVYTLILYACLSLIRSGEDEPKRSKLTVPICTGIVTLISFAFFFACPDGLVYSDGVTVWTQALSGAYSDWHPIVYVLIVKLCSLVYNKTVSYILFQTILWILVNYIVLRVLFRYHGSKACKIYVFTSITFGIMTYKYIVYLYKDPLFCMSLLAFSALLYDFSRGRRSVGGFIGLSVFGLLAALTRHAMVAPLIATLVIVLFAALIMDARKRKTGKDSDTGLTKPKTKRFLVLLLAVLVCMNALIHTAAMKLTNAEENEDYVTYTLPIHMLGAYAASGHEVDAQTREIMERVMPIEDWAKGYEQNPYWADNLSRVWGYIGNRIEVLDETVSGGELVAANARFFLSHPFTYVKEWGRITSMLWQISRPEGFLEWYSPYFENAEDSLDYLVEGYELEPNGFTVVLEKILVFTKEAPVLSNIICRGGAALFTILLCCYVLLRKKRINCAICALPTVIITLMLLLSIPAQDPRYVLALIETAIFIIPIAICQSKKSDALCADSSEKIQNEKGN